MRMMVMKLIMSDAVIQQMVLNVNVIAAPVRLSTGMKGLMNVPNETACVRVCDVEVKMRRHC